MATKKREKQEVDYDYIDKAFALTHDITARLRGKPDAPELATLDLMRSESEDYQAGQFRVESVMALKALYADMGDFLSRMDSKGTH